MVFIPSILEEHADEIATLLPLRESALQGFSATLSTLLKLDYRLDANLEGVHLAGKAGWRICERLREREPLAGIFAGAFYALSDDDPVYLRCILGDVLESREAASALVCALIWLPLEKVQPALDSFTASNQSVLRHIAALVLARHGINPGELLLQAVEESDPIQKASLLRAVSHVRRTDLLGLLYAQMASSHSSCRFWAAWSITLLGGSADARAVMESFTRAPGTYQERAIAIFSRGYKQQQSSNFIGSDLALPPRLAAAAAAGTGFSSAVPLLLEQMRTPETARFAGEALTTITGADVVSLSTASSKPLGLEAGPTDDPDNNNVNCDPDEGLPWPDADAISQWWKKNENKFQPRVRYLLGKPISTDWMYHVLWNGRHAQRIAASLELAMLRPKDGLFDVRAPAYRQHRKLYAGT